MSQFDEIVRELKTLDLSRMYQGDFFRTWDKSDQEIAGVFAVADALRNLRQRNLSVRMFDSGLGVLLCREEDPRSRFPFASACNLLGLEVQRLALDRTSCGESLWETLNRASFMADVIGIQDGTDPNQGHAYLQSAAGAVEEGFQNGVLEQRPTLVNLHCGMDHPTLALAGALHLIHHFGGVEQLRGKKVAMTWSCAPGGASPSLPQGVIGLMTRFGMDVVLAHPEGYEVLPQVEEAARANAQRSGGSYRRVASMDEAYEGADIVCSQSWSPCAAMERRAGLQGDAAGLQALEQELLAQNAQHRDWHCTGERMARTKAGKALCLPAGGVCQAGEMDASAVAHCRASLCQAASCQPYIIAAMIFLTQCQRPVEMLRDLEKRGRVRKKR